MNKIIGLAVVGAITLLVGAAVWSKSQPPVKRTQLADPALNRICHRYITKQSSVLPHLAITKFSDRNGETGGYADLSFDKEGVFEGVIFDTSGTEVNLGIPYGTASLDARQDLTVKANEKLAELKRDFETETVTWCDQ